MNYVASLELLAQVADGNLRAAGRLMSRAEAGTAEARAALAEIYRRAGRAHVIGLTGVPGSGKSTLVAKLTAALRARGERVGIVAVDPSSPYSGGAILGDRIRMTELAADPGVFIRSMATRGATGGMARAALDTVDILDVAGFTTVIIETVGVGQDEVDVGDLADTTLLIQVPGTGDAIQAIKAGVLEIADVLVVNKADLPGAHDLVRDLRMMLRLSDARPWTPPIIETVASEHRNTEALVDGIDQHRQFLEASGEGRKRRARRDRREVIRLARRQLTREIEAAADDAEIGGLLESLATRDIDPISVATAVARLTVARYRQDD